MYLGGHDGVGVCEGSEETVLLNVQYVLDIL